MEKNMIKDNLTFIEQAELLEKRGIKLYSLESTAKKLETISYYKLKDFAEPFNINKRRKDLEPKYENITFSEILRRYYQDKNLRIYLMHAIEKIEVSLKTRIAYNLGNMGAYGYLKESNWMDRSNNYIKNKATFQSILNKHEREDSYPKEIDFETGAYITRVPSVWIFINTLTFGELVKIYESMSKKRKRSIANYYKLEIDELYSFIKTLRLIRNMCAHNRNIIDIRLKSLPKINNKWKNYLLEIEEKDTCHLALVILIIKYFVDIINPRYKYREIRKNISSIIDGSDDKSRGIGFKDKKAYFELFDKK